MDLPFQDGLPPGYKGPFLEGAESSALPPGGAVAGAGVLGQWVIQQYNVPGAFIRHQSLQWKVKRWLGARTVPPGLYACFVLGDSIRLLVGELGRLALREGRLMIAGIAEEQPVSVRPESRETAQWLELWYSPDILEEAARFYPSLEPLTGKNQLFFHRRAIVTPAKLAALLRDILDCPYTAPTRQFYLEIKAREALVMLLEQLDRDYPPETITLSPWERARLEEARLLLVEHIAGPNITIRQLSRKVRLNEFKLKTGFRHIFHMGVFEYLTHLRMEKAHELILSTNLPLKDICQQTGYARLTNFVTAFKRHFGYTPGLLRRS